jgi:4-hydroxythreonine-4-phosphate dehydrogenase
MAGRAIEEAVRLVREGACGALTTCPVDKDAMNRGGYAWMGHTRMLADLDGADEVAMVFRSAAFSVVLVTDHVPLREVFSLLNVERVVRTVQLALDLYRRCGDPPPRVAVAGLNPHAGEGGLLGREDLEILAPAVEALRGAGCDASGPFPPDTVYLRARNAEFDLVAAPYHDQGLAALKTLGLGTSVHYTAGLSFIRTSVDHGTACALAGTGRADPRPLYAALREAARAAAAAA